MTTANLVNPNISITKDCRAIINYYAKIKLSLIDISTLRADLLALARYTEDAHQNANDILRKSIDVMNTDDIQGAMKDINETTGDVQKAYENELQDIISRRKQTMANLRNELYKPTFNLKMMNFTSNKFRLGELDTTKTNLQAISKLENGDDYYDVLLKNKKSLDAAIELFEGESFYDKISPLIEQVERVVTSESPAKFTRTLAKEGIEAAKNVLKMADAQLKYEDMVKARTEIIKKIMARDHRNDNTDRQLKYYFDEIAQIEDYERLREPKRQFVEEVEKIISSFDSFNQTVFSEPATDPMSVAQRFVNNASDFRSYADNLFRQWARV